MSLGRLKTVAKPLYQQVVDIMTRQISDGEWKSGELLPSEPKLAEQLGVSPGTVRKALDQLAQNQLVSRRQGVGTYVSVSTREDMMYRFFKLVATSGEGIMPDSEEIARRHGQATGTQQAIFDIGPEDDVVEIDRLRHCDGQAIMMETISIPVPRFKNFINKSANLPTTLYDFFEQEFGIKILRIEEKITAINADQNDAMTLNLPEGTALLCVERTAYSFGKAPIELRQYKLNPANHAYMSILS